MKSGVLALQAAKPRTSPATSIPGLLGLFQNVRAGPTCPGTRLFLSYEQWSESCAYSALPVTQLRAPQRRVECSLTEPRPYLAAPLQKRMLHDVSL